MSINQPQSERLKWGPVYGVKVYQSGSLIRRGTPSFFTDEWWLMDRKVAELHFNGDKFLEWTLYQNKTDNSIVTRRESQFLNSFGCPIGMMLRLRGNILVAHYSRSRMRFRQKDVKRFHSGCREWSVKAEEPFSINFQMAPTNTAYFPTIGIPAHIHTFFYKSNYGSLKVVATDNVVAEAEQYLVHSASKWKIIHFNDTVKMLMTPQLGALIPPHGNIYGDKLGLWYQFRACGLEADFKPVQLNKNLHRRRPITYRLTDISDDNRSCISPAIFLGGAHPMPEEEYRACRQPLPQEIDLFSLGNRLGCMPYLPKADQRYRPLHDALKDPAPST